MLLRSVLSLLLLALPVLAQVPPPKEWFGFNPGDDYKLANYDQITGYFKKLAASSDRIVLEEFGKSSEGRPMYVAFISDPENLKALAKHKAANRRLALGEAPAGEAAGLAAEGKAIVWIDSGLHASEVAPVQHSPHLAYRMLTAEDEETQRIRKNVILMQVPVINPDGLDMVAKWYAGNVGGPYEMAPMPWLYQKYAGHDNNRDYFMLNLPETRNVSRMLFREWFPQIVYNQHQVAPFPARIFIPPYAEPLNPYIPAPVMEGINIIGASMKERFARENKAGAISYFGFDAWWDGGLRSVPAFHNMHGILTETAGYGYATPGEYDPKKIPATFRNGWPTRQPTVFYENPWQGGRWALMDAIQYMLTADFAILDLASRRPDHFLKKSWETARAQIDEGAKGKPYAYVIPADQPDLWTAVEMLRRLQGSGVVVKRTLAPFTANGKTYASGAFLIETAQPFRGYLVDLMEPQKYPEMRTGAGGRLQRPYDLAGWTLPYQMGVRFDRLEAPVSVAASVEPDLQPLAPSFDHRSNSSFLATIALLKNGKPVRWAADGNVIADPQSAEWRAAKWELATPRVGLYQPWTANMDAGWTEWLLDTFQVPFTNLRNADIRAGALKVKYDTIILSQQAIPSMLHGYRVGEVSGRADWDVTESKTQQRPEYTGGIGVGGVEALQKFVEEGGTLLTFDTAGELPLQMFPLGIRGLLRAEGEWDAPGSILRGTVDPKHPFGFGMPEEIFFTTSGGQAYEVTLLDSANAGDRTIRPVAWYAKKDLLASGWLTGEKLAAGKPLMLDARMGKGRVVLYGFRPQFRGQSFGTFKLILNAVYLSSARQLTE